jgi:hypothetical protein
MEFNFEIQYKPAEQQDKPLNTLFLRSGKLFGDAFKPICNPLTLNVPKQVLKAVY